jgi:hypothetical protein
MVNSQKGNTIGQEEKSGAGDIDVEVHGPDGDNLIPIANSTEHELQNGNFTKNLNQPNKEDSLTMFVSNNVLHKSSTHVVLGSQLSPAIGSPHMAEGKVNNSGEDLGVMVAPLAKSLERSKRREGSVNEDSSARAERLKAKRNLDGPGTLS